MLGGLVRSVLSRSTSATAGLKLSRTMFCDAQRKFDIVVIGGGAGGCAVTASLLARDPTLKIAIVEPRELHKYQPGFTLVGAGVFTRSQCTRQMVECIPNGACWLEGTVKNILADDNQVELESGTKYEYDYLIASPGLQLNFNAVEGLEETLGKNGVTTNYLPQFAPYTFELVQNLKSGNAIFTQPIMPIKCAGAPQKAAYLSCSNWRNMGVLDNINVTFCNNNPGLFGNPAYVPALQETCKDYNIDVKFHHNLVKVDADNKKATFDISEDGKVVDQVVLDYDMLHVVPPQGPLDFMKNQPIADAAGWVDVDPITMQSTKYSNVFALGDGCNSGNAKTAAAVRKQAPIVAENLLNVREGKAPICAYDGYGSCPLTVSLNTVVLAEFGYDGLLPTFPTWLLEGTKPTRLAWFLKAKVMPHIYFDMMLKGHEWLAKPTKHIQISPNQSHL